MDVVLSSQSQPTPASRLHQNVDSGEGEICSFALKITLFVLGIIGAFIAIVLFPPEIGLLISGVSIGVPILIFTKNSWRGWSPNYFVRRPSYGYSYIPSYTLNFSQSTYSSDRMNYSPPIITGAHHHFGSGYPSNNGPTCSRPTHPFGSRSEIN